MHQLQLLRHKHSDTIRRCEHTMKELEYYRGQHIAVMNQLEAASQESSALRGKYGDLANDKQRLDREVQTLQKELSELRIQNQEVLVSDAAGNDMNQHYPPALRKYDAVKDEYDSLRKRYDDLIASHSSALELSKEEATRLKTDYEQVTLERNSAIRERNALKQQCTAAIRQWDIALRERNEYREALAKIQQQHEEAVKEINQAMVLRMKASKDMKRLTEERNAALQEYSLIMGERDTVHKEIEKLTDDLSQAYGKITHLESQNKQLVEEKKTLSYQIETLKREISSALQDRDEALQMCNELRQKFGDYSEGSSRDYKHRLELHSFSRERDSVIKEDAERETNTRDYAKRDKERMDNLDQANQELDKLRKAVDTLQAELEEALQEAEVSKRRRDWAFSERDKIVLERESIRTLCDRLRKERDRAVSELASALRDSDDIKKQRNEASKELKDLKEKIESGDHALRTSQLAQSLTCGHDASVVEGSDWEMVSIHVEPGRLHLDADRDLGLILVGGRDSPYYPNDNGVYVAQVTQGSAFDGKLRVNDCITRINNVDCTSVSSRIIMETLRSSGTVGPTTMIVRRRRITRRSLRTTQLSVGSVPHGITLELGIYISKISPGSLAAKDGNLAVGDRVLNINSKPMDTVTSVHEAMIILNDTTIDVLTITTLKGIPVPSAASSETMTTIDGFSAEKQKMVNSCSQTEQERMMLKASSDDYERRYLSTNFGERNVAYKAAKSVSGEKSSGISNAWDNFREKIDIVRGRKHGSKERDDKKKSHRNSSPNTYEQEQDAIAELDSVIDSYHKKANNGVLKRSKRRGAEKDEKNGGTWPKARGGPLIQNGTGTILHPRKTKERFPLSVILPKYDSHNYNRISNPTPLTSFSNVSNRHTVYKAVETPLPSFTKSGQLYSQRSFTPAAAVQFKDIPIDKKPPSSVEFVESAAAETRLGSVLAPSETSIDFSLKSGGATRADLDYFAASKRPQNPAPQTTATVYAGHMHTPSVDLHYHHKTRALPLGIPCDVPSAYSHGYEGGTLPGSRKEDQRIRIPSNTSVTSKSSVGKLSTGSIERTSERGSPMPTFHVEVLSPGTGGGGGSSTGSSTGGGSSGGTVRGSGGTKRASMPDYCYSQPRPAPGELRRVHIDKSVEPLGIQISCLESGGVFVSTVYEHSLASQVGLQIGDQLLEVCGINMRSATYQLAANVLRQCGNSITMLVQYSPDKYTELEGSASSSSSEAGDGEAGTGSHSGSPTPCNSPEAPRKGAVETLEPVEPERDATTTTTITITTTTSAAAPTITSTSTTMSSLRVERDMRPSASLDVRSTQEREREMRPSASLDINIRKPELRSAATLDRLSRAQMLRQNAMRSPTQEEQNRKPPPSGEPRYLLIETRKCSNLGISLVGGNGVGIFVHSVQPGCLAEEAGLFAGDRILEYNGVDLRQATAEQAALELARPADKVTLVAQYMPERYNEVKDKPGDSFYVKALFDRVGEVGDSLQLRFNKDDILYVDNTMFNGTPGHWRAWIVDQTGRRQTCGIIPSKFKVEEELLLRRSLGDLEQDAGKRSNTSARRSFFRRKKQQQRSSSSRDSKELSHLTGVNLGWYSDSGTLNEDTLPASYQRVERLDYPTLRPVLILGPLSECVVTKLLQEYSSQFTRCLAEAMHCSQATLEQGLRDSLYVDYRKKGSYFECTTVQAVKDICEKNTHCILDVSIASIDRLHRHQIYPIVLLIKFKDRAQIKEVKDSRYPSDKISTKAAKEMYEQALKMEAEYKHYISAVIPAGVSVAYICTQVKASVDDEQSKALWVPRGGP
ncbi:Disks large-like protein 5 [Harpegnathos saltator]|uniref:Disks large-like protein 5 n=1 Tax=Harpegnathos saltator TaxID=610380 RepID=E2BCP4_HARSA|nr:Disks large-like protein 5 [Harpegnathos saltator]